MKTKLQIAILMMAFLKPVFGSDLPYSISYQDRGPVIYHSTCRLTIDAYNYYGTPVYGAYKYEEFRDFLSLKGYRPYKLQDEYGYNVLELHEAKNIIQNDLLLKLSGSARFRDKKYPVIGELNYLISNKYYPVPVKEIAPFSSEERNYTSMINNTFKNSAKRSLFEIFEAMPECKSLDSGHSYEEEKYNPIIPVSEIATCSELFKNEVLELEYRNKSAGMGLTKITGYGSLTIAAAATSAMPLLPIGVGALTVHYGVKIPRNIKLKNMKDAYQWIKNISNCSSKISENKQCDIEKDMLKGLSRKSEKRMKKFFEFMTPEEFTQKVLDYLGSTKVCSESAKKIHKIKVKKLLKEVQKTI